MTQAAELRCRCGNVAGRVTNASPRTVNRVVCYCDDCQAFLHHLGRTDLLDAHGGTDVVQVAPATLSFHRGDNHIVGLQLTPKGLYRWYASCCNTPLGNTVTPGIPFVGIVARVFEGGDGGLGPDAYFGPPIGAIMGKFAIGEAPRGSTGLQLRLIARAILTVLDSRLRGRAWPHPFFDRESGAPSHPVETLTRAQREALRPLCGPRAKAYGA
jgi:hypothetical protein